jgi:hypothetical protein
MEARMNKVWVVTQTNGGKPGTFCECFEKAHTALASIGWSYHRLHVNIEKTSSRPDFYEVKVTVHDAQGNIDRVDLFEVIERPVFDTVEHL